MTPSASRPPTPSAAFARIACALAVLFLAPGSAGPAGATVRIAGPAEVLARCCVTRDGVVYFVAPGVAPQELVTSVEDPAVANKGDGSFHPFDVTEVENALAGVTCPVDRVDAVVYVLPYPRRAGLGSAAAPGAILLSPGTLPASIATVHAVVTHELGHVLQYALAPAGGAAWSNYLRLRRLAAPTYSESAPHADRPREIFAEDFRALFGSAAARGNGSIENPALPSPETVDGLRAAFLDLAERGPFAGAPLTRMAASPNPFGPATTLTLGPQARAASSTAAPLPPAGTEGVAGAAVVFQVYDVRGRLVRAQEVACAGDGSAGWNWDGRDDHGARLAPGAYFARALGDPGPATRIVLLR